MNMYEGTVEGGDMSLLASRKLYGQLVGELSDGGVFPLVYSKKSKVCLQFFINFTALWTYDVRACVEFVLVDSQLGHCGW